MSSALAVLIQNLYAAIPAEAAAAAAAKSLQSWPTLCDPTDGSPPDSSVPGILQARTLEWVAISFSSAWKWKVRLLSHAQLLATPWTAAQQAPLSMGFSRREHWSGCRCLLQAEAALRSKARTWKYSHNSKLKSSIFSDFSSVKRSTQWTHWNSFKI